MKAPSVKTVRCAIYTRVSTEHGLDQEFNSLDAQYDAASAYITLNSSAAFSPSRNSRLYLKSSKTPAAVLSSRHTRSRPG